jgi:hypothetical protein
MNLYFDKKSSQFWEGFFYEIIDIKLCISNSANK